MNATSKHFLIMIACCLIPAAALTAIFIFKIPPNNALTIGLVLLCPLSHVLMMKYMMPGHKHNPESHNHVTEKKA